MPVSQPMPTPVYPSDVADRTRRFFVPALLMDSSYNYMSFERRGFLTHPFATTHFIGHFMMPDDYSSGLTIYLLMRADSTSGLAWVEHSVHAGPDGDEYDYWADSTGAFGVGITLDGDNEFKDIGMSATLANFIKGYMVTLESSRYAGDVNDTYSGNMYWTGFIVQYLADM